MKNLLYTILLLTFLISCSSKNDDTASQEQYIESQDTDYNDTVQTSTPSTPDYSQQITESSQESGASSANDDYQSGYNSGYNMGQIAGQENMEYNPYLPVGPYARTHSLEYRQGYAAGYSAGYEKGQQNTHQGIYSDDEYNYDDGSEYYYEEDY